MVTPGQVDADLEGEVARECGKYGVVDSVYINETKNSNSEDAVRIFVSFASEEDAAKAQSALNGRFFAGRTVQARFYDEELFAREDYTG